ncbi:MAG: type 4a pilus biogenesis protein PilO [Fimbriimonadaceae bacterium]
MKAARTWNYVTVLSLVATLLMVVWTLLYPAPDPEENIGRYRREERQILENVETVRNQALALREVTDVAVWRVGPDLVAPAVLDEITALAKKHDIKLVAFRPQKTVDRDPLIQLPMTITLDGGFGKVSAMINDLDQPRNKVAMNLIQISSADGASDRVTATVGISAFIDPRKTLEDGDEA